MKLKGFRPASLAELIYFEMAYPELCAGVPIIALGSVYRDSFGINSVPQFVADKNGRNLFLDLVDGDWEIGDKFFGRCYLKLIPSTKCRRFFFIKPKRYGII